MRYHQRTVYPRCSKQPKTRSKKDVRVLRSDIVNKPSVPLTNPILIVDEGRWKNVGEVVDKGGENLLSPIGFRTELEI